MQRLILVVLVIILLASCDEQVEKYDYYQFRKQITPSGKYVIYDYARYGEMAFSSDISGTELFKIGEKFEEGKGLEINGSISEWISNDTLLVYNFKSELAQPKDTLPIRTEYVKLGDFTAKTIYYKSNSGALRTYEFDSVATTNDSIFFQIVENDKKRHILKFPLGAIIIETKSDSIRLVRVETEITKNMNFVYYNKDGTVTRGLPEVGTISYELKPTKMISSKALNQRKIFREQ
jgi:hypothetical protein